MKFVNLHTHSHFSLLDGLGKIPQYVKRAVTLEQPAVAITDHGGLSGAFQLYKECNSAGITPIIGCEFYIAPRERTRKEPVFFGSPEQRSDDISGAGKYGHITILAYNAQGVRNLYRLQADAYNTGFYGKPRIDMDLLAEHNEGLICLSGCPGSLLCTYVRLNQIENARTHLFDLKNIFNDRLFIEIMAHGIDFEPDMNQALIQLSQEVARPLVATGDAHYCHEEDVRTHQALLCVQTNSYMDNPKFSFSGSGYHLMDVHAMERAFQKAELPLDAITNTTMILDAIESYDQVFAHNLRMPESLSVPTDKFLDTVIQGLKKRVPDYAQQSGYGERLLYEVDVIASLGFAQYLTVVSEICSWARDANVRLGPARGSAAGSLVSFSLGITDLDPIQSGLIFERFINPQRAGLPDVDIDVQEDRRDELLEIIRTKFGEDYVAQLGTFGTIAARAGLKDSARVLGLPYEEGEARVQKLPRAKFGFQPSLDEYEGDKDDDVYRLAYNLEGTVRSEGVHAAAIIISPEPLTNQIPLRKAGGKGGWITGLDMHAIEDLGFVKTDLLGLRTLKVINDCLQLLVQREKLMAPPELPTSPQECNDPETYALLSRGETQGVFQLESFGMQRLLRELKPSTLNDIAGVLALYRPGPMAADAHTEFVRRSWRSMHPELDEALRPVLGETYGLIVFQEQVLKVLVAVGGYDYGSAELIFNAMRKKQHDKMAAAKPELIRRMKSKGYSNEAIETLWGVLVPFADYSFNKSHASGYSLISYWTAYLKANHPKEYMSSLMSNESDNDKLQEYLRECRRMGIPILPPDINESQESFTPTHNGIRYGLASIKGVGVKVIQSLRSTVPFRDVADFYHRAPKTALNARVLDPLVKSGAIDSLCPNREGHVSSLQRWSSKAISERQAKGKGQRGIVGATYKPPNKKRSNKSRQKWEEETLGVVITPTVRRCVIKKPLEPIEFEWLRNVCLQYPGEQQVVLELGSALRISTGCMVSDTGIRVLGKLEKLDILPEE